MIEAAAKGFIEGLFVLITVFGGGLCLIGLYVLLMTGKFRLPEVRTGFEPPEDE